MMLGTNFSTCIFPAKKLRKCKMQYMTLYHGKSSRLKFKLCSATSLAWGFSHFAFEKARIENRALDIFTFPLTFKRRAQTLFLSCRRFQLFPLSIQCVVEQKLQNFFISKSLGSNTTPDAFGQLSFCFAFLTKKIAAKSNHLLRRRWQWEDCIFGSVDIGRTS